MILSHRGVFLMVSDPLRNVFLCFQSTRDASEGLCDLCLLRVFLSFLDVFLIFLCISSLLGTS